MSDDNPLRRNNVSVLGQREAPCTLVFVHGFGSDRTAWHDVASAFLPQCRVVLLDNVGAGAARATAFTPERYATLGAYAEDLVEVAHALKLRDAILVGHSAGAMMCVLAALAQPTLASRLVLVGASPCYLNEPGYPGGLGPADVESIHAAMLDGYADWADRYAAMAMDNPERPQLAQRFAASLKAIPAERAWTVLSSILQSDHREDVRRIRVPTLVVQSRRDAAVPLPIAHYLARNIPGSRLEVVDAMGHFPHLSAPAEVVRVLRDFIA